MPFSKGRLTRNSEKMFYLRTTGPISTKFGTKHSSLKGVKVPTNEGSHPFLRWDNNVMTNSEKSLQIEYVCHKLIKRCFRIVYCMLICRKYVTTSMPEIKITPILFPSQDIQFWGVFCLGFYMYVPLENFAFIWRRHSQFETISLCRNYYMVYVYFGTLFNCLSR